MNASQGEKRHNLEGREGHINGQLQHSVKNHNPEMNQESRGSAPEGHPAEPGHQGCFLEEAPSS